MDSKMISHQEILNARILIVDDQRANVLLLEELLGTVGYTQVSSTMDPCVVCELHRNNHYDLILLDLLMPGMDGFQVMDGLQQVETDGYLPVLVITAQPEEKLRALSCGAKDFISKPFDLLEVKTRIYNMLEVRLLYKKLAEHNKQLEQTVLERTAELRDSEAQFRRLAELSSDWYWEQNEQGQFVKISGPVLAMLGIKTDALTGNSRDNEGALWIDSEREALETLLKARHPFLDFVYRRIDAGGSVHYYMVSGEPMFDSSGRYEGYRGIGKNVVGTLPLLKTAGEF
jgi:PAS domain S-box-containing protein